MKAKDLERIKNKTIEDIVVHETERNGPKRIVQFELIFTDKTKLRISASYKTAKAAMVRPGKIPIPGAVLPELSFSEG